MENTVKLKTEGRNILFMTIVVIFSKISISKNINAYKNLHNNGNPLKQNPNKSFVEIWTADPAFS